MTYCRCYSCKYLLRYELKTEYGQIFANFFPFASYIYTYYMKSEEIHETGLSGNVVTSFFSSHNIYIYIYIYMGVCMYVCIYLFIYS